MDVLIALEPAMLPPAHTSLHRDACCIVQCLLTETALFHTFPSGKRALHVNSPPHKGAPWLQLFTQRLTCTEGRVPKLPKLQALQFADRFCCHWTLSPGTHSEMLPGLFLCLPLSAVPRVLSHFNGTLAHLQQLFHHQKSGGMKAGFRWELTPWTAKQTKP